MLDSNASTSAGSVAQGSPPTRAPLDIAQLKGQLAEEGYVVLPGVVSRDGLEAVEARLADEFSRWKASEQRFRGGGLLSGHLNCFPGEAARGVIEELRDSGTLAACQQLFATDPRAARIGCNFNLPGSVAQHYHMDGAFLESYLIVNVAVVDTDLVNGAIDVIPGTHKRFYKYWEFAAHRLYRAAKRIPVSRGDVLVRLSTLWHRGMPNYSSKHRPMLALTLGEKGISTDDPCTAYNRGAVEFQANWFKTNLLGQLRERTVTMAPITYSAYRFVRSLVGSKGYASF